MKWTVPHYILEFRLSWNRVAQQEGTQDLEHIDLWLFGGQFG